MRFLAIYTNWFPFDGCENKRNVFMNHTDLPLILMTILSSSSSVVDTNEFRYINMCIYEKSHLCSWRIQL